LISVSDNWAATKGTLQRFQRDKGQPWTRVGEPVQITLGNAGLGWGRGLHSRVGANEPVKREGDGRSPAGVFLIGNSYGYDKATEALAWPYQRVDGDWRCVNDAASLHYNKVIDAKTTRNDWNDAEHMRLRDGRYELVLEIDHNHIIPGDLASLPHAGSCIFLHVWLGPETPTTGCTAMALTAMQELLSWLRPDTTPVFVALPREVYASLQQPWSLPRPPR